MAPGSVGPAALQCPPCSAKMPADPGRAHFAATTGGPDGLNATAVSAAGAHERAADVAASRRRLVSVVQPVRPCSTRPVRSSASS